MDTAMKAAVRKSIDNTMQPVIDLIVMSLDTANEISRARGVPPELLQEFEDIYLAVFCEVVREQLREDTDD